MLSGPAYGKRLGALMGRWLPITLGPLLLYETARVEPGLSGWPELLGGVGSMLTALVGGLALLGGTIRATGDRLAFLQAPRGLSMILPLLLIGEVTKHLEWGFDPRLAVGAPLGVLVEYTPWLWVAGVGTIVLLACHADHRRLIALTPARVIAAVALVVLLWPVPPGIWRLASVRGLMSPDAGGYGPIGLWTPPLACGVLLLSCVVIALQSKAGAPGDGPALDDELLLLVPTSGPAHEPTKTFGQRGLN